MRMSEQEKKGLVPALRFPEFRNAESWAEKQIGHVSETVTAGGTPSTLEKKYWGGGIRWMNSGELNFKKVREVQGRITESGLQNSSTKIIPKMCVLIGLAGQGKTRGTVAMNMVELCINQSIAAIFPNEDNFSSEFLYHNLDNRYDELRSLSAGGEGRGGLNLQIIKSLSVPFPNLKEQQKIADCLTSIDELITAQTRKLDALKTHKKGLMQQLFPAEGETTPKLRFPEFRDKGEWKLKKLGQLATYTKGFAFKSQDYRSEGIRIIRVSDLGAEFIKPDNEKVFITSELAEDYERYKLNKDEIIITTVGSKPELVDSAVGRGVFVHHPNEGVLNQNLLKLEVLVEVNSRFLFSNINTTEYQEFITSISRGNANQANIAVKELMKFELKVPGADEQQKIADCLASVDDLITAQTQKLETLKTHKKGLMQQLFPAIDDNCMDTKAEMDGA